MVDEESNGPEAHADTDPESAPRPESDLDLGSETWLERLATAEDATPEEVLERLVSSYWVLEEIYGVLDQTGKGQTAGSPSHTDSDENLDEWTHLFHDEATATRMSDELAEIRDRLDRLEANSETGDSEDDGQADPYQELRGQLTMLTQRIDAIKGQLTDRQRSLDARVDQELEYLIPILEYLIETTDDIKDTLYAVTEQQDALRDRQDTQDQLVDLKQRASRLGVHTATCGHCETSVDLRLLPTPDCPECENRFQDIIPASGLFGWGTNTLTVEETETPPDSP